MTREIKEHNSSRIMLRGGNILQLMWLSCISILSKTSVKMSGEFPLSTSHTSFIKFYIKESTIFPATLLPPFILGCNRTARGFSSFKGNLVLNERAHIRPTFNSTGVWFLYCYISGSVVVIKILSSIVRFPQLVLF